MAPRKFAPLTADHPAVVEQQKCAACERAFVAGDETTLVPKKHIEGSLWEAALLHWPCGLIVAGAHQLQRERDDLRAEVKMLRAVAAAATRLVKADKAGSFDEEMKTSIVAFRELAKALAELEAGR